VLFDMTLIAIVVATLLAGVGSVWLAAWLSNKALGHHTPHLLSLAAGALLATAFLNLLPEAFESEAGAHALFITLLLGLVFFFLLDKAELYHHGHEHHHDAGLHDHHGHGHHAHAGGGWPVLLGDSVHAFGDGVLIAAAFMADMRLGVAATVAVLAHEVPHHIGDLVVVRQSGSINRALGLVSAAGCAAAIGGVLGYFVMERIEQIQPYMLTLAASSFIYVALADLIPQLQKRLRARETVTQVLWLAAGLGMVMLASVLAGHGH
jgi:zinc and cadmium transporter